MEANKIMSADLLDIIFEGKNKAYGAYDLRKTYDRRVTMAVIIMFAVCLLFFLSQILGNNNAEVRPKMISTEVRLKNLAEQKEVVPKPPTIHLLRPIAPRVRISRFSTPVITKDIEVKEQIPDIQELEQAKIGNIKQDGTKDESYVAPPVEASGTGVVDKPEKDVEDYEKTFTKVEVAAQFPGGMEGWKKFLERNLNANIAAEDGAPKGNYTVKVQFIVDKEGNISNVQAIDFPAACRSCSKEAMDVIEKGPRWEPAIQNGKKVIYQAIQFITFQVAEE